MEMLDWGNSVPKGDWELVLIGPGGTRIGELPVTIKEATPLRELAAYLLGLAGPLVRKPVLAPVERIMRMESAGNNNVLNFRIVM